MFGIGSAVASLVGSYYGSRKGRREGPERAPGRGKTERRLPPDKDDIVKTVDAQIGSGNLQVSRRSCPECGRNFSILHVNGAEIDCCTFCKSLWFDAGELMVLTGLGSDVPSDGHVHRASKHACPVCSGAMEERVFMKNANLLVDTCPAGHGVYLDGGKLKRAFMAGRQ